VVSADDQRGGGLGGDESQHVSDGGSLRHLDDRRVRHGSAHAE
jgi:hypothetical protein